TAVATKPKPQPLGCGCYHILGSERENGERSLDVEVFYAGGITAIDKLPVRWGELKTEHATQP
ncbi:MAG: hypothetical protein OXH39_00005, partial [Candidatus Poribacteria bacterium]|nr:hypothetical protein [Candidatus Poribacteria bacterium]